MTDQADRLKSALADRYAVERELGSGGMATVYLAEDLKHGRKVAVKVLRPQLAASLGPDRFVREIEIAAQLTHPHILPLHDSGEADGFLYYVMPFIEGESLRERLDRDGKLSVADTIRVTDQVASALHFAHERGVVHRDVKPENIMLAGDQAIVADFGIARAVEAAGGERLTGTGLAIGTPAYMSPEQAFGQEDVDARSDVYSLGCVVYEMVGGRAPFEGATPQALLAKHAADTVPGLRTSDAAIPVFVERAVGRALAKLPTDRFQSVSAFADALTSGTVVPWVGRRRARRRTTAMAAAGIAAVAAVGWWLAAVAGGPDITRLAVLPFTNLMNDPEQEYLVQGMHEAVISELTQAGVTVIARSSVMSYGNTDTPARDIAAQLGVDALIEGSAFRSGDSVGIQVRLFDGDTEEYLWSQSYDADLQNVFGLYRGVARSIVDEIQLAITPEAEARLAGAREVDPEAYEAYLRGRFHSYQFTPADQDLALQYFEAALQIDPDYALPYIGMASVWGSRLVMGVVPPHEVGPRWKEAVSKALAVDSTIGAAHGALAVVTTWVDWDWDAAEAAYRRAIQLNPNDGDTRIFYGHFLMIVRGRAEEARVEIERALELDPLNSLYHDLYGHYLTWVHRYDDAIAQYRTALQTSPNQPLSRRGLWRAFELKGMYDEALNEAKAFLAAIGDGDAVAALELGYADTGYFGAMTSLADMLVARSRLMYVKPLSIAELYGTAGKMDEAFEWLERAYTARDHDMVYIRVWAVSDAMRSDPRFDDLLRRMNLPGRNDE